MASQHSRECQGLLNATDSRDLASFDGDDVEGCEGPQVASTTHGRAKVLGLVAAAAVAAVTLRSLTPAEVERGAAQAKYGMGTYMQAEVAGAEDPWAFRCPSGETSECCKGYRTKNMPLAFPQCGNGTAGPCASCEKATPLEDLRARPPAALAGLAWAAAVDVKGTAPPFAVDFESDMFFGSRGHISQTCPNMTGWDSWQEVKFDPKLADHTAPGHLAASDIGVKAYIHYARKVAIVAFRGVEFKNLIDYMIETSITMETIKTPSGLPLRIHKRFLNTTNSVLPQIKSWVEGIPADTQLLFTGHGMGGSLAIIAATLTHVQRWRREPDALIAFGAPRISDSSLKNYWDATPGWCDKMLRVNVYNDMVPHMPLTNPWFTFAALAKCERDARKCIGADRVMKGIGDHPVFSELWKSTCPQSEVYIPGAMRGINKEKDEENPTGGVLVHTMQNCQFGYGYGVMKTLAKVDGYCGLAKAELICPSQQCTTTQDLKAQRCIGLEQWPLTPEQSKDTDTVSKICRQRCCDDMFCDVWQSMDDKTCWLGRKDQVRCSDGGNGVVAGGDTI